MKRVSSMRKLGSAALAACFFLLGAEVASHAEEPGLGEGMGSIAPEPDPMMNELQDDQAAELGGEQSEEDQLQEQENSMETEEELDQESLQDRQNEEFEGMQEHLEEE